MQRDTWREGYVQSERERRRQRLLGESADDREGRLQREHPCLQSQQLIGNLPHASTGTSTLQLCSVFADLTEGLDHEITPQSHAQRQ